MIRSLWRILNYHPGTGPKRLGLPRWMPYRLRHQLMSIWLVRWWLRRQEAIFEKRSRESYNAYIQDSDAWIDKRKRILRRDDYECLRCKGRVGDLQPDGQPIKWLEVHHYNYENFGYESDEDLGTYCPWCHKIEDDIRKGRKRRRRR